MVEIFNFFVLLFLIFWEKKKLCNEWKKNLPKFANVRWKNVWEIFVLITMTLALILLLLSFSSLQNWWNNKTWWWTKKPIVKLHWCVTSDTSYDKIKKTLSYNTKKIRLNFISITWPNTWSEIIHSLKKQSNLKVMFVQSQPRCLKITEKVSFNIAS